MTHASLNHQDEIVLPSDPELELIESLDDEAFGYYSQDVAVSDIPLARQLRAALDDGQFLLIGSFIVGALHAHVTPHQVKTCAQAAGLDDQLIHTALSDHFGEAVPAPLVAALNLHW